MIMRIFQVARKRNFKHACSSKCGRTKTEIHVENVTKAFANKKTNQRTLIIEGQKLIREIEKKMRGRRGTCKVGRLARKELKEQWFEETIYIYIYIYIYKEVSNNLPCLDLYHRSFSITFDFGGTNTNHHATRKVRWSVTIAYSRTQLESWDSSGKRERNSQQIDFVSEIRLSRRRYECPMELRRLLEVYRIQLMYVTTLNAAVLYMCLSTVTSV